MSSYNWNWAMFGQSAEGARTYGDWLISGVGVTLALGLVSWMAAMALGLVIGLARTVRPKALRFVATTYVELFRSVPLIAQLFIWYFAVPEIVPGGGWFKSLNPFVQQFLAGAACLAVFTAARVAEQVRAGVEAIPTGQWLAARALGFNELQVYRFVLLPVALRTILPPLTSEFLAVFKNSAVVSTIGLLELAAQGRQLVDYTAQPYEAFIAVTVAYLMINGTVIGLMALLERRVRIPTAADGRRT